MSPCHLHILAGPPRGCYEDHHDSEVEAIAQRHAPSEWQSQGQCGSSSCCDHTACPQWHLRSIRDCIKGRRDSCASDGDWTHFLTKQQWYLRIISDAHTAGSLWSPLLYQQIVMKPKMFLADHFTKRSLGLLIVCFLRLLQWEASCISKRAPSLA